MLGINLCFRSSSVSLVCEMIRVSLSRIHLNPFLIDLFGYLSRGHIWVELSQMLSELLAEDCITRLRLSLTWSISWRKQRWILVVCWRCCFYWLARIQLLLELWVYSSRLEWRCLRHINRRLMWQLWIGLNLPSLVSLNLEIWSTSLLTRRFLLLLKFRIKRRWYQSMVVSREMRWMNLTLDGLCRSLTLTIGILRHKLLRLSVC